MRQIIWNAIVTPFFVLVCVSLRSLRECSVDVEIVCWQAANLKSKSLTRRIPGW